jgi:uncharacterized membrane protein YdjX (TVP38/TMEM64 family)
MDTVKRKVLLTDILLILLLVAALIVLGIFFGPKIWKLATHIEALRAAILSAGPWGVFVFLGMQVLQVVVAFIPGEVVQIAGGYLYGTILGTVYSLAGILAGSVIAFCIARYLGYRVIRVFVKPEDLEKFAFLMNDPRADTVLFLLFLIPGIPKDTLVYAVGLTPVRPFRFFVLFTVARFPAMLAASFMGANLQSRHYLLVIVVSVIACVLFALGFLFKDKLLARFSRKTDALPKEPVGK